ncbi:MAG: tRNA pseudouridine(55) synthase TruB [Gammaproteobacteria bacterium]
MKPILKKINGILLLDKSLHITSNGALQRVKRLFSAKKAGHTGSLDPLATGMLPICFGEATKVSQFLLDSDKHYLVDIKLGVKTTTGDAEGEIIATQPVTDVTPERLVDVLRQFLGDIQQIPPMFSALKHQGKPLYELARKGIEVERKPRPVTIHSLHLIALNEDILSLDVHCSKGTYVRTLAEDIGTELGCGAHVCSLRRSAVSPYQQNKMYTFQELEEILNEYGVDALQQCLLPMDTSVQHLPAIKLSSSATFYIRMGQPVIVPHLPTEGCVRIFSDDAQFIGIGEVMDDGRIAPRRLISAA